MFWSMCLLIEVSLMTVPFFSPLNCEPMACSCWCFTLQAADGAAIVLQPGANRLAFRLHVMKQGLYVLKHAHCRLGRLALRLRAAFPDEQGPPLDALTVLPPALPAAAADAQFFTGSGPPVGAIDALGGPPLL